MVKDDLDAQLDLALELDDYRDEWLKERAMEKDYDVEGANRIAKKMKEIIADIFCEEGDGP